MHQCWWSSPGANWSLSPSQEQRAGRLTHVSLPMGLALLAHSLPHHGDSHTPSSASPASKSQGGSRAPLSQHPQAPPPTTDSPQPCNPPQGSPAAPHLWSAAGSGRGWAQPGVAVWRVLAASSPWCCQSLPSTARSRQGMALLGWQTWGCPVWCGAGAGGQLGQGTLGAPCLQHSLCLGCAGQSMVWRVGTQGGQGVRGWVRQCRETWSGGRRWGKMRALGPAVGAQGMGWGGCRGGQAAPC